MKLIKNDFKRSAIILGAVLIFASMCGCDLFSGVDLTKEESELIAEYSAGLLRKYDTNGKLKDIKQVDAEEMPEEIMPTPEPTPEIVEEPVPGQNPDELDFNEASDALDVIDASDDTATEEEIATSGSSIADAFDIEGFDITYQGYELCDKYPENADNSWLISMAAREGKKLCVIKLGITNVSNSEGVCDILNAGKSYRLIVNEDTRINETVTVLMDSFSQFAENLAIGESRETVLIFEPDASLADSISSLKLIIKDSETSDTFDLQ